MGARILTTLLLAAAFPALGAADAAAGKDAPSPGVAWGWDGVAAPGGKVRYVALTAGRSTTVAAVRIDGGRVLRFRSVQGSYGVPLVAYDGTTDGLTRDGRTLFLASPPHGGARVSRFAVVSTRNLALRRVVTLRGAFSYDALSPDGSTLYLIEYVSARDYSRYRVRAYDLEQGRLLAQVIADRRSEETEMRGSPVTRVSTADGGWAYTLYAGGHHPFVHALDTRGRQAVCIDLPWHGKQDPLWTMRLTLSADERTIVLRGTGRRIALPAPR